MTPERWQQVKAVLEDVLTGDVATRASRLEAACAGDDDLRRDVESLMVHTQEDGLFDRPAISRQPPVPPEARDSPLQIETGPRQEIRPAELPPYTRLVIRTERTRYEVIVSTPLELELLLKGGERFPHTTRAHLDEQDVIRVGQPMQMLVGTRRIMTSTIRSIEVLG